jgi:hypothetical protein
MLKKLILFLLIGLVLVHPALAFELESLQAELHGFLDARYGQRLQSDPYQEQNSLEETRLQLEFNRMGELTTLQVRADFYYDAIVDQGSVDLREGSGWLDLREANLLFSPQAITDVKLGRQILTWGTGDLLFINDLFPKDWQSFFIGRDVDYLKAPSDAALVSFFPEWANIDLVYTPRFDADRFISGERLSYWNPARQSLAGKDAVVRAVRPDKAFADDEWSLRISRNIAGYEWAFYGYEGYWKSPVGFDPDIGKATFPRLRVLGASVRGNFGKGIASVEGGYYDSLDDRDGDDPLVPNSEWRGLVGYEQEVMRNVTAGLQYYLEAMQDHARYLEGVTSSAKARDEYRQVMTVRFTWQLLNQNLMLSLFNYWSPTDQDGYLRPVISYKLTDEWQLTTGANLFWGADDHTFFGQFAKNNNLYAGLRYNF